jgi:predicted transcriptional regulator
MEVQFTPDQEAQLAQLAQRLGENQEQIVRDAVTQFLNDVRFAQAVQKGLKSLDRGEFLEHHEVGQRLERILRSS